MTMITKIAGVAAAALVLSTTLASAGDYTVASRAVLKFNAVACQLASGEFPDDIFVINKGVLVLKAGTKVNWSIPSAPYAKGVHTLVADLAGGKSVFVSNAIPGGIEAGNACKAKL